MNDFDPTFPTAGASYPTPPPPGPTGSPPPGWQPQQPGPSAESSLAQRDPLNVDAELAERAYQTGAQSLQQSEATTNRIQQLGEQENQRLQQQSQRMQPFYDSLAKAFMEPVPQPPAQTQIPKAPTWQDAQAMDPNQAWLTAAMFLGTLGGALTRRPITNALSAFTGIVEGYNQGQNQNFDRMMKQWEASNKEALEKQEQANKKYQQILEARNLSLEQKQIALQVEAMRQKDEGMIHASQIQNLEIVAQLQDQRSKYAMDMYRAIEEKNKAIQTERDKELDRQNRLQVAGLRAGGANAQSDDAINMRAEMMLDGNPLATRGMSVRSADWARTMDRFTELAKEKGLSSEEIMRRQTQYAGETSYQRTAGTMGARIEAASNEVNELAPLAVQASRNMPRTDFTAVNDLIQHGLSVNTGFLAHIPGIPGEVHIPVSQKDFSDPRYYDFLVRNFSLAKAYGRAMNPQGVPRVSENAEARAMNMLSMNTSKEAYEIQVRALLDEVAASKKAVASTRSGATNPTITPNSLGLADPNAPPHPPGLPPQGTPIQQGEFAPYYEGRVPTVSWSDWLKGAPPGTTITPVQ